MATTDEGTKSDSTKHRYKLVGAKGQGERVDRLVLEGTSANPTRYIDLGGEGEMTEEEAATARKEHGVELRKVGDPEKTDSSDDSAGQAPVVGSREQQQAVQAGPGSTAGKSSDKPGKS